MATNRYQTVPGCTKSYDANGSLLNDCLHTYTWTADGAVRKVDNTVTFTYDALGRAVEQARGTVYTQIVYGPAGGKLALMNGQAVQKAFIPLPGGATAVYTSTGLAFYRHSDLLGSSRLATTPSRTLYADVQYGPYGEAYGASGSTDVDFTGQDEDTASGLYDFLFREYNTNHGRWVSPDPAGLSAVSMTDPQTWNQYTYVRNAPLVSVDPLGLIRSDCIGCNLSVYSSGQLFMINGMIAAPMLSCRWRRPEEVASLVSCAMDAPHQDLTQINMVIHTVMF